jgi:AraC family ethanolamine operon transcriptional activator
MRSQVFRDFDAFAESVRDVDSRMLLRNATRRVWYTSSVDLGRIDVQLGRLGSGNIAQGALRPDGYMLYLPLTDAVEYTANGNVLERNSFAILEPGCEFCISTKDPHDWCVAFVPSDSFTDVGGLPESAPGSCWVTRPNRQAANRFRAVAIEILNAASTCSHFESSPAAARAAAEIVNAASLIVSPGAAIEPHRQGRPRVSRQQIIRLSMESLERSPAEPANVAQLAAAADVSERTLRTAFTEYFGVGPIRYLQLRRLHQVHRALQAAAPEETTVSEILVRHGEWSFSRFACSYRTLFGELPSVTLRSTTG